MYCQFESEQLFSKHDKFKFQDFSNTAMSYSKTLILRSNSVATHWCMPPPPMGLGSGTIVLKKVYRAKSPEMAIHFTNPIAYFKSKPLSFTFTQRGFHNIRLQAIVLDRNFILPLMHFTSLQGLCSSIRHLLL